jgi:hypothetical protein
MLVVDINTLKEIEVPTGYHECSVCGEYHPVEEFNNDNSKVRTRTNCSKCYNLKRDDFMKKIEETKNLKKSNKYNIIKNNIKRKNEQIQEEQYSSVLVEDLIESLKQLPKGSKVVIEQEGYYCEERYGEIYLNPKLDKKATQDIYIIGYGGSGAFC